MAGNIGKGAFAYDDDYKKTAFQIWVQNGYPTSGQLAHMLPDMEGRKPSSRTIDFWMRDGRWVEQKDIIEAQAQDMVYEDLASRRAEMFKAQAEAAGKIFVKGVQYLEEHEFENTKAALDAIKWAAETQRQALGVGGGLVQIMNLSNSEVSSELVDLLKRLSPEEVVDVMSVEDVKDGVQNAEAPNP